MGQRITITEYDTQGRMLEPAKMAPMYGASIYLQPALLNNPPQGITTNTHNRIVPDRSDNGMTNILIDPREQKFQLSPTYVPTLHKNVKVRARAVSPSPRPRCENWAQSCTRAGQGRSHGGAPDSAAKTRACRRLR